MMPYLASPRQANGPLRPLAPGSIASSGRRTSWSLISHWIEARIESLGVISVAEKPSVSVGTRKPRTGFFSSSVRAQTTATSAMVASPIQRFSPFKTQSEPSFLAKVFMLAGSEPAAGSVRPKQPIVSPLAIGGSHLCFWFSDPNLWMALMASEPCTLTKVLRPESPASSSMHARPYSTALLPTHPYPERCIPSRPSSANSGTISLGKMASSYHPSMFGLILSCTKDLTFSLMLLSSSERWASMFRRSIGSGRAEEPVSLVLPALVTAIFSPLSEPHHQPGLFHSAHLRVANTFSDAACWPLRRDRATLGAWRMVGSCR